MRVSVSGGVGSSVCLNVFRVHFYRARRIAMFNGSGPRKGGPEPRS